MGKHYIKLLAKDNFCRKWHFDSLEDRNKAFESVKGTFQSETTTKIPFIEVDIGIEEFSNSPTITFPLRLKVEAKDRVIKYIDSLT